jgi:nucleoporin SEH1
MDQHATSEHDPIQLSLDAVTRRLHRPAFLSNLTPSRLPSRAASDSSVSPGEAPNAPHHAEARSLHRGHSHLNIVTLEDAVEEADLVLPLLQEPSADGSAAAIDASVQHRLEAGFWGARNAYSHMASAGFQTFAHGHQDLVLAVDFNYFGTRMVTASSDHRLKVWDKKEESWSLVESWKAHDAEIVDVSGTISTPGGEPGRCAAVLLHPIVKFAMA